MRSIIQNARFYLDATPILDLEWTGISVVCANIARQLLQRGLQVRFCLGDRTLPTESVIEALDLSTGAYLARELETKRIASSPLQHEPSTLTIGLSASVKRFRRLFDIECSWIHDISTILQPEYHTDDNIAWHTERVVEDVCSNDLTVCISYTTRDDVVAYLGIDPARLVVAPNGVEWPWWYAARYRNEPRPPDEPYILVLGTREPRKNLSLLFRTLAEHPSFLSEFKVWIVGGNGWLSNGELLPELATFVERGRIVSPGFLSDYDKYVCLAGAEMTVFPSLFEGFGLPVLESLSVGTPCVASFSSSLPEIGGSLCQYFDPFSPTALHDAIKRTLAQNLKSNPAFASACRSMVAEFTWSSMADRVLERLSVIASRRGDRGAGNDRKEAIRTG